MQRHFNYVTGIALAIAFSFVPPLRADEPNPPAATIDDDLFEGLTPAKPQPKETTPPSEDLIQGEDIELGPPLDPFARLAKKMQRSQSALAEKDPSGQTQELQQEIVTDLDRLLEQMQKQCKGGNCNKPGNKPSAGNSAASQKSKPQSGTQSTQRVGEAGKTEAELVEGASTIRDVWGHLPPKVREAMQNSSLEQFLPKYERLIGDFYRKLAETDKE